MRRAEPTLVVDFGTTTSTAALLDRGRVRLLKEPGTGSWTWPSAVCLAEETLLVGTAAEHSKRSYPTAYRTEFKRDLGDGGRIPLGEKSFTPQDLVVEVLLNFAPIARRAASGPLEHLVLTIPGSYAPHDPRRDLMIEAGRRAGFRDVEVLAEPVAAALAPAEGPPLPPDAVVLVYDFGGGTFDAAAVRLAADAGEVLDYGSRDRCGGRDVDAHLRRIVTERLGDAVVAELDGPLDGLDPERLGAARRARLEFADRIREAKHQLTDAPVAADYFASVEVRIQRMELNARIVPILQETIDCCRQVLAGCKVEVDDLAAILLVGGSTRMPVVADTLRREFGRPIRFAEDPGTAVASGAAQWSRTQPDRVLAPMPTDDGHVPLRWDLPGGSGTLVRWLADVGTTLASGDPLLVVRTAAGALTTLTCGTDAQVSALHAEPGDEVFARQWLATVREVAGAPPASPAGGTTSAPTRERGTPGTTPRRAATGPAQDGDIGTLAFDPTGTRLLSGGRDGVIGVWDVASGRRSASVLTAGEIGTLAWSGADDRVVVAHRGRLLELVDLATGQQLWESRHAELSAVAVDRTHGRVATVSPAGALQIRDATTGSVVSDGPGTGGRRAIAFDGAGRFVAAGTSRGSLVLWQAAPLRELRQIPLVAEGVPVTGVVFGPGDEWVAAGLTDGRVVLRRVGGAEVARFALPAAVGTVAAAERPGAGLVAACSDRHARVWSVPGPDEPLLTLHANSRIHTAALSPDGRLLATAGDGGVVQFTEVPEAPGTA